MQHVACFEERTHSKHSKATCDAGSVHQRLTARHSGCATLCSSHSPKWPATIVAAAPYDAGCRRHEAHARTLLPLVSCSGPRSVSPAGHASRSQERSFQHGHATLVNRLAELTIALCSAKRSASAHAGQGSQWPWFASIAPLGDGQAILQWLSCTPFTTPSCSSCPCFADAMHTLPAHSPDARPRVTQSNEQISSDVHNAAGISSLLSHTCHAAALVMLTFHSFLLLAQ